VSSSKLTGCASQPGGKLLFASAAFATRAFETYQRSI
jgi:hypothetical protein